VIRNGTDSVLHLDVINMIEAVAKVALRREKIVDLVSPRRIRGHSDASTSTCSGHWLRRRWVINDWPSMRPAGTRHLCGRHPYDRRPPHLDGSGTELQPGQDHREIIDLRIDSEK
jgi:hypothetical protein